MVHWIGLGVRTGVMLAEAQAVIAFRLMGMAGVWPVAPSEALKMLTEKPAAFAKAAKGAGAAVMHGKRPDQIAAAALAPIGRTTRSNAKRLAKRGRR